jgi:hypothetical protein
MIWITGVGVGDGVKVGVGGIGVRKLSVAIVGVVFFSLTSASGVNVGVLVGFRGGVNTKSQAENRKTRSKNTTILLPKVNRSTGYFTAIIIPHYSVKNHKK